MYWDTFDVYIAVAMMRQDAILESRSYYCDFETQGLITTGVLVVDGKNVTKKPPNADVILKIDKRVVKSVCLSNLSR